MSKRPLAGRKAFFARGQRARCIGLPVNMRVGKNWPEWAKAAWVDGWMTSRNAVSKATGEPQ
jgi:hypothetical protein